MTSRGNPSISPPAQISQQRHGNAIPSGTPPPQQYYTGQSPALSQGGYDFIPSQQPLLSYQAYGSAVNDVRTQPGNGVRGAHPQQPTAAMHQQGGAAYYPQQGQNIRPQHPHQSAGSVNQQTYTFQFYLSGQGGMRPRAHHPGTAQPLVYSIPQSFPGNVVLGAAQPMFQNRPQMNAYYQVPQNYVFLAQPNGAGTQWRGPAVPQQSVPTARQPREKKVIRIEDPNTGKDLTEELINTASHSHHEHTEQEEEQAQVTPSAPDICKLFTQKVAATLRTPSEEAAVSPSQQVDNTQVPPNMPPPQQYQQPPPVPGSQPPTHMMRSGMPPGAGMVRMPPTHIMPPRPPHMMQPPQGQGPQTAGSQPGSDMQRFNVTLPPPILRQPTPTQVYNTAQQLHSRHPPPQSQALPSRQPAGIPIIAPQATTQAQQQPPISQPQTQQPPVQHPYPQPVQPPPVPTQPTAQQHSQSEPPPAAAISQPEKISTLAPSVAEKISPPEESATPVPSLEQIVPSQEAANTVGEAGDVPTPALQAEGTDSAVSLGASNKGVKDGRAKGKKNKKDLNTKEIGGSDMDAFIDKPSCSIKSVEKINGKFIVTKGAQTHIKAKPLSNGHSYADYNRSTLTSARDPKNPWNLCNNSFIKTEVDGHDVNSDEALRAKKPIKDVALIFSSVHREQENGKVHQTEYSKSSTQERVAHVQLNNTVRESRLSVPKIVIVDPSGVESSSEEVDSSAKGVDDCSTVCRYTSIIADQDTSKRHLFLMAHCQKELTIFKREAEVFNEKEVMPAPIEGLMGEKSTSVSLGTLVHLDMVQARQGSGENCTPTKNIALENSSLNNAYEQVSAQAGDFSGSQSATDAELRATDQLTVLTNGSVQNQESGSQSSSSSASPVESDVAVTHTDSAVKATDVHEHGASKEQKQQCVQQQESKHKLKKKKKKKGRKSPPLPKSKQGAMNNGPSEDKGSNDSSPSTTENPMPEAHRETSSPDQPETAQVVRETTTSTDTSKEVSDPTPVVEEKKDVPKTETPAPVQKPLQTQESPTTPLAVEAKSSVESTSAKPLESESKPDNSDSSPASNESQLGVDDDAKVDEKPAVSPVNGVPSQTPHEVSCEKSIDKSQPEQPLSPVNDENMPPSQSVPPPAKDDLVDGEAPSSIASTPSEQSDAPDEKDAKPSRRTYDRAYLMELRECAVSQTKPDNLPNLEIILDRPMNRAASGTSPDFTPTFFQTSTPQRHPPQMGKSTSRGRGGGRPGDMQMPQRVIKSVSIQNDVKSLHQSEKPWKPKPKQLASGELATKVDNLESKALFIMNRLTPTNFEALSKEMMNLQIKDYDQLQQLVKIIFDKVTIETKFVGAYATLCRKMCGLKVPPPPGLKETQASFRVLLLTKCQTEFESDKAIVFECPEEKRKKLETEMPEAPDKREKIDHILYHMKLRRLKFYGNIRFIGELFKLTLLTENIMHDCIFRLLKARDDESLLSLCQLITTVGQQLDTDKAKARMDQYFDKMMKIAEERKSRIKFTLKDVIELRANHWVPRKEQTGPKKIDEVRTDFAQEQQTKQFLQNQPPPPRQDPGPGSRRGSRQRQDEKPPTDDGWNTVGNKSMKLDASKMKLSRTVVDENNIQLGPGGGMNRFAMWGKGSGAASQQSMDSGRPANRYSALTNDEDRRFQRSPSRGDGGMMNRGMRQTNTAGHGRGRINTGRSSMEGDRRDALNSARNLGGRSQNSSRDNSWNRDDRRSLGPRGSREGESMGPPRLTLRPSTERPYSNNAPTSAPPKTPEPTVVPGYGTVKRSAPKTEEEMEHSAKTIMDEYLNIRDLKEAKLCIMELEGQIYLHSFVMASMNNVLERSDKDRLATGEFFFEILKDNLIPLETFTKGLAAVIEFAEDMVIDIPKMWTNLAQMIVPTLEGNSLPWSKLTPIMDKYLQPMSSAKLLAEIMLVVKGTRNEGEAAALWQSSGLSWETYVPADRLSDFIKDRKLEFLQGPAKPNQDRMEKELVDVIRNGKSEDVDAFVQDKIPKDLDENSFVRMLMTSVCKASLSEDLKPHADVIIKHQKVLQKYIKSPQLELQALYAIQALMHKLQHPKSVAITVIETLFNEEVISEESLKKWETSKEEEEGKGPCLLSLTQFFTWLKENDDIETS